MPTRHELSTVAQKARDEAQLKSILTVGLAFVLAVAGRDLPTAFASARKFIERADGEEPGWRTMDP